MAHADDRPVPPLVVGVPASLEQERLGAQRVWHVEQVRLEPLDLESHQLRAGLSHDGESLPRALEPLAAPPAPTHDVEVPLCERDIAEQAGLAAHAHADEELGGPRLGERYQDVASSPLVADGINRDLIEKAQFQEARSRPFNGDGVVQRFGVEPQLPADNALLSDVIAANDDVADVVLVLLGYLEHHVDQGRLSGHVGSPRRRR